VDSTGFGLQSFYRHYSAKYGHDQNYRDFLKLHAMVGTKTNVIACAEVTDRNTHDAPILPGLAETTAEHFTMAQVSADKAYSSKRNLETIDALGAEPLIPFKTNTRVRKDSALWNKLFHFFQFNRDEFLPMYHKRSNAESTFSALKRKFGDTLRSKTDVARRNELLLIVLCHNIVCVIHEIHENGISPTFGARS
jgi:transposase